VAARQRWAALTKGTESGGWIVHPSTADSTATRPVPLTDLGRGTYHGFEGGLYPGGSNEPPLTHHELGLAQARRIQPLDQAGQPAPREGGGKIALLALGFSNPRIEFDGFAARAVPDPRLNPPLVLVNGCQSGRDAEMTMDPQWGYWDTVAGRLREAGVSPAQVQVVWLKQVIAREHHPFPADAQRLLQALRRIVDHLPHAYPNLRLVYCSSRIYGGYSGPTSAGAEPHVYAGGLAVKWLLKERLAGGLAAPWVAWGPYLWADGAHPRRDGQAWLPEDFRPDHLHPNEQGTQKVTGLLWNFFTAQPTTRPWFLRPESPRGGEL
jgi:hypothetical protein